MTRDAYRITRVYTRGGDHGLTGLVNGQRVAKHHPRIAAYGTVDELSSHVGLVRGFLAAERDAFDDPDAAERLDALFAYIQNLLFTLGGDLATPLADRHPQMPVVTAEHVTWLEAVCDTFNARLAPLTDFVLPAGGRVVAQVHVARCVCRRAERHVARLADLEPDGVAAVCLVFLNRLSDALFVLARWTGHLQGRAEVVWNRALPAPPLA